MVAISPAGPYTLAPVRLASSATSPVWSPWPCVTSIASTLPRASRFLCAGGVFGLFVMNGSMTMIFPLGEVILVAAWPSHCTSTLALHARP